MVPIHLIDVLELVGVCLFTASPCHAQKANVLGFRVRVQNSSGQHCVCTVLAPMAANPNSLAKKAEALVHDIRKWDTEFCCIGTKKESFTIPKADELAPRIQENLKYFAVNYAICLTFFALVAIVVYPQLLVLVCVFSGLWYGVLTRPSNFKVQVGATLLTKRHLMYALGGLNGLSVLIFVRTHLFATIGASFLFVILHAAFHSVPAKAKSNQDDEEREP